MAHYQLRGNSSSGFSCNSEAKASELLKNLEEMFPLLKSLNRSLTRYYKIYMLIKLCTENALDILPNEYFHGMA